jgi:hypothetical protein
VLDLEAFLRVMGARIVLNEGDALFYGNGHNGYLFWDPTEELWHLLPFDMGSAGWGNPPGSFTTVRDVHVNRLLNRPWVQRLYFRLIESFADGYWSAEEAGPFMAALRDDVGLSPPLRYVSQIDTLIKARLFQFTNVPIRILTNDGNEFTTDGEVVTLQGEASVRLETYCGATTMARRSGLKLNGSPLPGGRRFFR